MNVDILIVGQGLAGTSFALELYKRGISFMIIDKGIDQGSSVVSAGLYNPVGYKRMVPAWNHEYLQKKLKAFYKDAEFLLGGKYIFSMNSFKIFSSADDRDVFYNKPEGQRLEEYTDGVLKNELPGFKVPFGFLSFNDTGYLDVRAYLTDARVFFEKKGYIISEEFVNDNLRIRENRYNNILFNKIVFCTGAQNSNDFWNSLPYKPVKGELMKIEMNADVGKNILVKDGFLLPVGKNTFILGSTYDWNDLSIETSESGLSELKKKAEKFTDLEYRIIEKRVGVRPASHDRRPYVGWHPVFESAGIINGLGSKGVVFAPYCAEILANSYQKTENIPREIDVKRVRLK